MFLNVRKESVKEKRIDGKDHCWSVVQKVM